MPRRARLDTPGALHDVICRDIVRRKISWQDFGHNDFLKRLETILGKTKARYLLQSHAYDFRYALARVA